MRRVLAIIGLLCLLLTLTGLAYAAQGTETEKGISVYRGWGTDRELLAAAIVDFEAAYPHIKVAIHDIADSDYMAALMVQLASGVGPDIFMIQAPDAALFIKSGVVMDLSAYY